jgi:hypothetical protein
MGYAMFLRRIAECLPDADTIQVYSLDTVRARNRIVGHFLLQPSLEKFTHLLFVDDDNWPEKATIVQEMADLDVDVVMAPCTNKRLPLRWCHETWPDAHVPDPKGCIDVKAVGMGFTMISRRCLEKIASLERWYTDWPSTQRCPNVFGQLFERLTPGDDPEEEALRSEDYSFCRRWRELGGKIHIYVHAGIIFHAGSHAWSAREIPGGTQR